MTPAVSVTPFRTGDPRRRGGVPGELAVTSIGEIEIRRIVPAIETCVVTIEPRERVELAHALIASLPDSYTHGRLEHGDGLDLLDRLLSKLTEER